MTLIKVLPASAKAPGVPARTGEMTETRQSAKRESGGNIFKTGHQSREKEKRGGVGESKERTRHGSLITLTGPRSPIIINNILYTFNIYPHAFS